MLSFITRVVKSYSSDHVSFFAAALAYYALFSLTPMLFLLAGVFGFVLNGNPQMEQAVLQELVKLTELLFPTQPQMANQMVGFLQKGAIPITSISLVVLLWASSGFFASLTYALNVIFKDDAKPFQDSSAERPSRGLAWRQVGVVFRFLRSRMVGLVSPVLLGFGIIVLALVGFALSFTLRYVPATAGFKGMLELLVPVFGAFALFFIVYKMMPSPAPRTRIALISAALAAVTWEGMRLMLPKLLPRTQVYELLYGPLAGFLLVLIGFYLTMWILLGGAIIAKVLTEGKNDA